MNQSAENGLGLRHALSRAAHWLNALADDGPDLRVNAHRKAAHEAAELAESPSLEEFADVLICLVGTALHQGYAEADIARAVLVKTAINTHREWEQAPDGTWQHRPIPPGKTRRVNVPRSAITGRFIPSTNPEPGDPQ